MKNADNARNHRRVAPAALPRLLRLARSRNGHDRLRASRQLHVSPSTITNWEDHGRRPQAKQLPDLAKYVGRTLAYLGRVCGREVGR